MSLTLSKCRMGALHTDHALPTLTPFLSCDSKARLDKLGLSDAIIEKTAYVYRKAQEKNLIRGRSTSAILVAAIYASCREIGASRTLKDIAAGTNVKRRDISRSYACAFACHFLYHGPFCYHCACRVYPDSKEAVLRLFEPVCMHFYVNTVVVF
jgi:hypothetical protein